MEGHEGERQRRGRTGFMSFVKVGPRDKWAERKHGDQIGCGCVKRENVEVNWSNSRWDE